MDASVTVGAPGRAAARVDARRVLPHLPIAVIVAGYAAWFSALSVSVYRGYGSPPFDMAIPDQGIWLLSRFHAPFVTVMGRDLFADHVSFILVALVPLYWVAPSAVTLLVVQSLLLAAAAVPLYLYVWRRTASTAVATLLAGAFLLDPALQNGNLEQFHVECFTVALLSLALFAALESRPRLLAVSVGLLLLCKEDTAFLVAPLGLWVLWRRDRRWGAAILAAAAAWSALATGVVVRTMLGAVTAHGQRLPFGGVAGILRTAVSRPGRLLSYLGGDGRPFYVWQMFLSAGWVFLVAPEVAAIGVLTLGVNLISSFGYQHQINYHYSMPLVPVLAFGSAFAVVRLGSGRARRLAATAVAACGLSACIVWGLAPFSLETYPHWSPSSPEVHDINAVLAGLPPDAVVSAWYPYVAHIDHRTRIYMWPTPFAARYWGLYRHEGQRLPFAGQVDWLVLPTGLSGADAAPFASVSPHFHPVRRAGDVVLYERNAPAGGVSPAGGGPAAAGAPRT